MLPASCNLEVMMEIMEMMDRQWTVAHHNKTILKNYSLYIDLLLILNSVPP